MTIHQLVVDLENEPGRLFSVSEAIAAAGVTTYATTLSDGGGSGTARMLVSDARRARATVMGLDVPARTEEVLVIVIPDTPGSLAEVLEPIYDEYVNVLNLTACSLTDGRAVAVISFSDNRIAEGILREHGNEPIAPAELFPEPEDEA